MPVPQLEHPARFAWGEQHNITRHVLEYMTLTDRDNITRPYLLEKWEASEDLKTWTLFLREGVKWNNGDDFVSDDVVFTLKENLDPEVGSSLLGLMDYLPTTGIEKVDDYTVKLHLDRPQIAVPEHLFHYTLQILNRNTFEGDITEAPVGTGPYTLEEHIPEERSVLKRREGYWQTGADGEPLPYLDGITFVDLGEDRAAWVNAFKSGQIDYLRDPQTTEWEALKDDPEAVVDAVTTATTRLLRMRADVEPWSDNRVRTALKLCQDRERILKLAYAGEGMVGQDHHVAPVHPEYCEMKTPEYDPERAKALLEEAGYPDGLDVELAVPVGWSDAVAYAEMLKQDAEPAGFRINLNTMPESAYWDIWTDVDFGITAWSHRPLGGMVLSLAYICDDEGEPVPWNETHWCDEEFKELLIRAEGILDVEERRQVMCELQRIQEERGTVGVAFWMNKWAIARKNFHNVKAHPSRYLLWNEVWYDPEA
jgi:peptide/nickel transport system substrate-binding protein